LAVIESRVSDPGAGLPYDLFLWISRMVPMVNVDLFITDGNGRVLLTWRDDEIYGAGWHVPGGIIRFSETAEERIRAVARDELGTAVTYEPIPLVEELIHPERAARGHHIALVYRCRLTSPPDPDLRHDGGPKTRGQWAWHDRWPEDVLPEHRSYQRLLRESEWASGRMPRSS
jgi:ADP-ribose pyrophosphatase YjhB (NUDIX family)